MVTTYSPYDINFKFMRNVAPDESQENPDDLLPKKIDEVTISMSPVHAKAMLAVIYTTLQEYENAVGKISLTKAEEEAFNKIFKNTIDHEQENADPI